MNNHFSYLIDDAAFFHKVACERAEADGARPRKLATSMIKKASSQSSFEKWASRLDSDLAMLKEVGEYGANAGMMKRADAYFDWISSQGDLSRQELALLFDKIAAEAIQTDLDAIYAEATSIAPEHEHWIVERTLAKVGHEMAHYALLEKQASFGTAAGELLSGEGRMLGRLRAGAAGGAEVAKAGLSAAGRGVARGVSGLGEGIAAGAKGIGRQIARPAKYLAEEGAKFRSLRRARGLEAPLRIEKDLQTARLAEKDKGLRGIAARGASKSLEKQLGAAKAKQRGILGAEAGGALFPPKPKKLLAPSTEQIATTGGRPAGTTAEGIKPTTTQEIAKSRQMKTQLETEKGQEKAREAAKLPREKRKASAPNEKPPTPPEGIKGPELMATWKKLTTKGWKSLTQEERGAMIRAGVTGAAAYRVATGKGVVTGGEGLI